MVGTSGINSVKTLTTGFTCANSITNGTIRTIKIDTRWSKLAQSDDYGENTDRNSAEDLGAIVVPLLTAWVFGTVAMEINPILAIIGGPVAYVVAWKAYQEAP